MDLSFVEEIVEEGTRNHIFGSFSSPCQRPGKHEGRAVKPKGECGNGAKNSPSERPESAVARLKGDSSTLAVAVRLDCWRYRS